MTSKIMIKEEINSKNLGMRASVKDLFQKWNQSRDKSLVIDFTNVEFMSRSFAQEYVQQKKHSNKTIKEVNVPEDVELMFEVVLNTNKPSSKFLAHQ